MRRRSLVFTLLGTVLWGFTFLLVIQQYPADPCRGVDCGTRLFGLLPQMVGVVAGGLFLATGTFECVADRRQSVRLAWYPFWGLLGAVVIGAYMLVFGSAIPGYFYWFPIATVGSIGIVREVWSW